MISPHRLPLLVAWVGALVFAPAALGQYNTRLSLDEFGGESDDDSSNAETSANGRYVAFDSVATNLVVGDTNGFRDCFVYDTLKQTVERVSVALFDVQGDADSFTPTISDDGRWVTFVSEATNLVPNDTNGAQDSFLFDRSQDLIWRVSVSSTDKQANNTSSLPMISGDGLHVVFGAWASNLVQNDTNGTQDIFVRDLALASTTRLSLSSSGVEGNGYCKAPSLSYSGRYVTFESEASNLVPGDTNGERDIFLHDRVLSETTRISVSTQGVEADDDSRRAAISDDGRWIVFASEASNLVDIDTNDQVDVFLRDRLNGTTVRVSEPYDGVPADGESTRPSISADGSVVTFESLASNLVAGDFNGQQDIFRWDRGTGTITRVSIGYDGSEVDGDCHRARVSADGRKVAFHTESSKLVPFDMNGEEDIFQHGTLLTLEADALTLSVGDTLNLELWRAEPASPMAHILIGYDGNPMFLPVHFGFFAADGVYHNATTVPPAASGHTFELRSYACCGAAGPGLFASNDVTLVVK